MSTTTDRKIRAVCPHDCPDTCGMVVTVRGDRAIALKGDMDHPFTKGFLCSKVAKYLERVYHPDRLQHPLRRVGPKGQGEFQRISWDEAIAEIATRFRTIANSPEGPQAILPYSYGGTMGELQGASLDRRFFHRLGASLLDRTICATAGVAGCDITLGTRAVMDPEAIIHAKTMINWGSNTSVTNSHLWALMHRARKAGAKIISIDPYRTPTCAKSDWWIAIRPGTDAALALGLMHVIWREGWQDDDYMAKYCLGTEQLRERVKNEYPPEKVAAITGIAVADIEKLARMVAVDQPSCIRLNYGLQRHRGGGMAVRTVCCLPAIVGSWRHVGGGALLSTSRMYPFNQNALQRPDLIPPGTRTVNMSLLAEALAGEIAPPAIRALYVYNANPASVNPDQSRVRQGLLREDLFTVVHDQFLTDTARYADIVLPATTQLEHFDIHGSYGHFYVQTNERAIPPLAESKPNTEVFRRLGRAMGFEPELFAASDEDLAREALKSVPTPARFPDVKAFNGLTREELQQRGPVRLNIPTNFTPFAEGGFGTPSGKCEFYSAALAAQGLDPLPTYTPPSEDPQTRPELAARFPLQMVSPPHPAFLNSTFANLNSARSAAIEPTVELTAKDAAARNLHDGDRVRVFNDRGAFQAVLRITDNIRPGVAVTLGTWWSRDTKDGNNVNATTSTTLTDFGAGATFFDNLVQVEEIKN